VEQTATKDAIVADNKQPKKNQTTGNKAAAEHASGNNPQAAASPALSRLSAAELKEISKKDLCEHIKQIIAAAFDTRPEPENQESGGGTKTSNSQSHSHSEKKKKEFVKENKATARETKDHLVKVYTKLANLTARKSRWAPTAKAKSTKNGDKNEKKPMPTSTATTAFVVGARVEAKFDDGDSFYPGVVTAVREREKKCAKSGAKKEKGGSKIGTCSITFDDGDQDDSVPFEDMRLLLTTDANTAAAGGGNAATTTAAIGEHGSKDGTDEKMELTDDGQRDNGAEKEAGDTTAGVSSTSCVPHHLRPADPLAGDRRAALVDHLAGMNDAQLHALCLAHSVGRCFQIYINRIQLPPHPPPPPAPLCHGRAHAYYLDTRV
jgi:hypothetical protein